MQADAHHPSMTTRFRAPFRISDAAALKSTTRPPLLADMMQGSPQFPIARAIAWDPAGPIGAAEAGTKGSAIIRAAAAMRFFMMMSSDGTITIRKVLLFAESSEISYLLRIRCVLTF
ncbi:hypothetical protein [uncultured Bradyrhizobium sp.]|uniref:hypothetical protein n=1 Tax=uncultured Bradyrhizobium sp. TaxID=199684 RepID=UPI00262F6D64|nr:hypothetical protein [uncultured Bradyrhizobium sp.]